MFEDMIDEILKISKEVKVLEQREKEIEHKIEQKLKEVLSFVEAFKKELGWSDFIVHTDIGKFDLGRFKYIDGYGRVYSITDDYSALEYFVENLDKIIEEFLKEAMREVKSKKARISAYVERVEKIYQCLMSKF